MKTVLVLLSTDRYAIPLIRYLLREGKHYRWKTTIGSMFEHAFVDRIKEEQGANDLTFININEFRQCEQAIKKSDIVVAMMPDVMLLQVADACINYGKPLVSPSRLNRQLFAKKTKAEESKTIILAECGFNPGLDHVTAKKMIDNIHLKGGDIASFKTYCGSIVGESSLDNPWEFKLTEPAADIINLGKGNNRHLFHNQLQHVSYHQLFTRTEPIDIAGIQNTVAIPDDDALYYRKIYDIPEATTVIKYRILRGGFESVWNILVQLGLTNSSAKIEVFDDRSFKKFLSSFLPYSPGDSLENILRKSVNASTADIEKLKWLGLFEDEWLEGYKEITPAVVLQHLMEQKLSLQPDDKDCVIMRHVLEYHSERGSKKFVATLVIHGEDHRNTAIAKAIGLTTAAAAKAVLIGSIKLKGLHTPVRKEIYEPMLNELADLGIAFHVEEESIPEAQIS